VYVEGRLQTRNYEDKDGQKRYFTEVVADDLILLGGKGDSGGGAPGGDFDRPVSMPRSAQRPQAVSGSPAPAEEFNQGITDDDVPF
jgi:single-strand DNA-binding protein